MHFSYHYYYKMFLNYTNYNNLAYKNVQDEYFRAYKTSESLTLKPYVSYSHKSEMIGINVIKY